MEREKTSEWVDPYDQASNISADERRVYARHPSRYRLHIATHQGKGAKPLVAQGEVLNVSVSGIYLQTKHKLEVGQLVDLAIPTKGCPPDFALPKAFLGRARVARVEPGKDDVVSAALAVDQDLLDDMSYAVFVEYQHRKSLTSAPRKRK